MGYTLRPDQERGIGMIVGALRDGHKAIMVQAPTGAGKSVCMTEIVRRSVAKGKRPLIVVPKIQLIDQFRDHLEKVGVEFGVMQSNHERTDPFAPVQLACMATLLRRRVPAFDVCLIDEAHRVYKGMAKIMHDLNNIPFIGWSATPFTKGLAKIYTKLIKLSDINELISGGHLVDAEYYAPYSMKLPETKGAGSDYRQEDLDESAKDKSLTGNIIDHWFKLASGKKTIVGATNIAHSKSIVEAFRNEGVKAGHIDCYTDDEERRELIAGFKEGDLQVLSSVAVLSEGADFPNAECLIIARISRSLIFHRQLIGRVLRPHPGKAFATVIDHSSNVIRLGFATGQTPDQLDDGKPKESNGVKKEKEEPLPKMCPACHYLKPPKVHECPKCHFKPERQTEIIEEAGQLKKIREAPISHDEKKRWYNQLLYISRNRGYADGWAYHKYHEKFGVYPNGIRKAPVQPGMEVINYVKHLDVKRGYKNKRVSGLECRG